MAVRSLPRYRCIICGYVYDPEKGDPGQGVTPGTPFEQLPKMYQCPICKAYATAGGRKPFVRMD